ncbi:methyltransferase domain-containing protein [Pseudonocardiaceae bacterium YIM PH 21723]|nr:methyltransferase domain-containing protein [Pseudonocardiaceae bacterium YIM PH 21723]
MTEITSAKIGEFYDSTDSAFGTLFDGCIHSGYFADGAGTLTEAQDRLTEQVLRAARLTAGSAVLDAGCGHGRPAVQAAVGHGALVTGVTLSAAQQRTATEAAEHAGVGDKVRILVGDMTDLPFPDGHFDAVFAIESIQHVPDQAAAFRELARVLRPGGRLVAADYVSIRPETEEEAGTAAAVLQLAPLRSAQQWQQAAIDAGLTEVRGTDLTSAIRPSAAAFSAEVRSRHDVLVAAVGEQTTDMLGQAVALYNRRMVADQGYLLLEARRP